jgi:transposase InsO family protein
MPWQECDRVTERVEFLELLTGGTVTMSELCRRFGISRKTGYKWRKRHEAGGRAELLDRSRRPLSSPCRTPQEIECLVVKFRGQHPRWGGRKLRRRLLDLGHTGIPAASTITEILRRHGLLVEPERPTRDFQRFEHAEPNDLWQMDFKGHFAMRGGQRCHPLTVLDDHSRYSMGLRALLNEQRSTTQLELEGLFRTYGLPRAILCDNGSPWGSGTQGQVTALSAWLIKQGVRVTHGRPYHPQTQGKDERFHRTLKAEVLQGREFRDASECQSAFDAWREVYNHDRPHEALELGVPSSRYSPSPRSYKESPEPWDYGHGAQTRKVDVSGYISFEGTRLRASHGLHRERVEVRPSAEDGVHDIYFCRTWIRQVDLRSPPGE